MKKGLPQIGQDNATLERYGLIHKTVIDAAERTQGRARGFQPRGLADTYNLFDKLRDEPGGGPVETY